MTEQVHMTKSEMVAAQQHIMTMAAMFMAAPKGSWASVLIGRGLEYSDPRSLALVLAGEMCDIQADKVLSMISKGELVVTDDDPDFDFLDNELP